MKHLVWLFLSLACLIAQGADDKVRTWTDIQGRSRQAQFVREVDGDATFLENGKLITIPLDQLSEADRKVIRELEANKVLPEDARPAAEEVGTDANNPFKALDPAAGTGGFLVEAYNHLSKQVKTVADRRVLQEKSLFGCEPKTLP